MPPRPLLAAVVLAVLLPTAVALAAGSDRLADADGDVQPVGMRPATIDDDAYDLRRVDLVARQATLDVQVRTDAVLQPEGASNGLTLVVADAADRDAASNRWVLTYEVDGETSALHVDRDEGTTTTGFCRPPSLLVGGQVATARIPPACLAQVPRSTGLWVAVETYVFETFRVGEQRGWSDTSPDAGDPVGPVVPGDVAAYPVVDVVDATDACPSDAGGAGFTDVDDGVHADAIRCAASLDVVEGFGDGTYRPSVTLTRGQVAALLVRAAAAAGEPVPASTNDACREAQGVFVDDVERLVEAGIVPLSTCTTGAEPVPRGDVAAWTERLLARTLDAPAGERTDLFRDDDGHPAQLLIEQLAERGVLAGTSRGVAAPGGTLTRGQAASVVARAIAVLTA